MSLKEYNRKRDFQRTPEPEGFPKPTSKDLKFFVQLHDATRLHYDLRLEIDGALKKLGPPKGTFSQSLWIKD